MVLLFFSFPLSIFGLGLNLLGIAYRLVVFGNPNCCDRDVGRVRFLALRERAAMLVVLFGE